MVNGGEAHTITVIYRDQRTEAGAKGLADGVAQVVQQIGRLNVSTVSENMASFCRGVASSLKSIELAELPYLLDTVELTVELTGSGEVRLVGSVGAELSGGLKLTFKKT